MSEGRKAATQPLSSTSRGGLYQDLIVATISGWPSHHTTHGVTVEGRGVFRLHAPHARLCYVGQCRDGRACGLGVFTTQGRTEYAGHGPDGHFDGPHLTVSDSGTREFRMFREGKEIGAGSRACQWPPLEPQRPAAGKPGGLLTFQTRTDSFVLCQGGQAGLLF
jgi:hypothetical protein